MWRESPWSGRDSVDYATREWVHWHNSTRPHSFCGDIAPLELEDRYYTETSRPDEVGAPLPAL